MWFIRPVSVLLSPSSESWSGRCHAVTPHTPLFGASLLTGATGAGFGPGLVWCGLVDVPFGSTWTLRTKSHCLFSPCAVHCLCLQSMSVANCKHKSQAFKSHVKSPANGNGNGNATATAPAPATATVHPGWRLSHPNAGLNTDSDIPIPASLNPPHRRSLPGPGSCSHPHTLFPEVRLYS